MGKTGTQETDVPRGAQIWSGAVGTGAGGEDGEEGGAGVGVEDPGEDEGDPDAARDAPQKIIAAANRNARTQECLSRDRL